MEGKTIEYKVAEALNKVAAVWAKEFGYKMVKSEIENPTDHYHFLQAAKAVEIPVVKYVDPEDKAGYIHTRQRFGAPCISISAPGQEWFVGLEMKGTEVSQAQVWYPKAFEMLEPIKIQVEDAITLHLNA